MAETTIHNLNKFGQSVWFDNINRALIDSGRLKDLIDLGLSGMTSNPTIFDKAISQSVSYDDRIIQLNKSGKSVFEIYDDLTVRDIQDAADIFRPVYEKTVKLDGYVSLEVNPLLASKPKETIEEAKRLHKKVDRPNVMFKIPATPAGFEAVEELLALGINVNVTLIFSQKQYEDTARAFLSGVKRFSKKVDDLSSIASVASVFVSRVDTYIDKIIDEPGNSTRNKLQSLKGKAAIANSQMIFKKYLDIFSQDDFRKLQSRNLRPQRVLWASTSTKNPEYSDIKYVTELIGRNSVNTLPDNTFDAFLDHGTIKESLPGNIENAKRVIDGLREFNIDVDNVCSTLLSDGVEAFEKSFNSLLQSIEEKSKNLANYKI